MKVSKINIWKYNGKWHWAFKVTYSGLPMPIVVGGSAQHWADARDRAIQERTYRITGRV